ncbi:type II toxin-antitoxin system VapC family toxin [Candidatus Poriferisocius sp.]|uniref:type II toxin-antitoxin system VapC family toxin n=1 Tax=Candidatus Poriferisocius sp. TaxID=3101276 RepID=UPI003B0208F8
MTAVVDASLLVGALISSGSDGRWCETAIARGSLAAPELALVETTNILRRLELSGATSGPETTAAQRDLLRLDLTLYPFAPFAARVWELRANLTAYDAWYVALAEALNWPLITLDRRIGGANGPRCEVILPPSTP